MLKCLKGVIDGEASNPALNSELGCYCLAGLLVCRQIGHPK